MNHSTARRLDRNSLTEFALLAVIAFGNFLLVARSRDTTPALILIAVALVILIASKNVRMVRVPLLVPLALFLVSGWLSIAVSYDTAASWKKFWLLCGGVALYLVIASLETQWTRAAVVWGLLLFCAGAALYFVTQHDFAREPAKLGIVNQIGLALHRLTPQFGLHVPHANVFAGILLLGLPFGIGASWDAIRRRAYLAAIASLLITLWITFGLAMTTSRGAMLSFGIVIFMGVLMWLALRLAKRAQLSPNVALAVLINFALAALILFFVIGGSAARALINTLLGSANGVPRSEIFQQSFHLGQDVSFTGIGLDTFALNYASYTLLIDVLFLPHAHNVYLQVWIEQGLLGIVAFAWWILAFYVWVWRGREGMSWLALAGIASVTLMLLHGVVDVLFYFSRVAPLMFIPFGLAVSVLNDSPAPQPILSSMRARLVMAGAFVTLIALSALFIFARRTELVAQWDANRGAARQAQIELPQYHFSDRILRIVRGQVNLDPAIELFEQALARDPNNRVANLRLGIIELDRGDFDAAIQHIETAHRADPTNRAAAKALGYAYVWTGKLDEAVKLLRAIDEAPIELQTAAGVWGQKKEPALAQNAVTVIERLKKK